MVLNKYILFAKMNIFKIILISSNRLKPFRYSSFSFGHSLVERQEKIDGVDTEREKQSE